MYENTLVIIIISTSGRDIKRIRTTIRRRSISLLYFVSEINSLDTDVNLENGQFGLKPYSKLWLKFEKDQFLENKQFGLKPDSKLWLKFEKDQFLENRQFGLEPDSKLWLRFKNDHMETRLFGLKHDSKH